jgi:hypothetical protein
VRILHTERVEYSAAGEVLQRLPRDLLNYHPQHLISVTVVAKSRAGLCGKRSFEHDEILRFVNQSRIISFVMALPSQTSHGSLDLAVRGSQRAFSEE